MQKRLRAALAVLCALAAGPALAEPAADGLRGAFASASEPLEVTAVSFHAPGAAARAAFERSLSLCPGMRVSNAPAYDAERRVENYASLVSVNGVMLAVNPTTGACLSSAFGQRGRSVHRGLDFYSAVGGPIMAAADGVVIERAYRDDYGNMLLIDHGNGVYTRYAHLARFEDGIIAGATVHAGEHIADMGNTASYRIATHLHYELLLGEYDNPRGSFGLTAHSPFEFPAAS